MKIKDFIGIALLSVFLFPVILLVLFLATGVIHLEVGLDEKAKKQTNSYLRKYHPRQDEAEVQHMKTYEALQKKEQELAQKQSDFNRELERLENLKNENARIKAETIKNREKIEKLVSESKEIQNKRLKALAEVYGSMRPEEAAPILLTLSNKMVADILRLIPEVRSQSKLMGALGTMDLKRAARISQLMGKTSRKG